MSQNSDHSDAQYTSAEIRRIIDRATDLDAQKAETVSEATLYEIASELGLSTESIRAALREHPASPLQTVAPARSIPMTHLAGLGAGTSFVLTLGRIPLEFAGVILLTCSLVIAMESRGPNQLRGFWKSNGALWAGVIIGPLVLSVSFIVMSVVTGVVGGLLGSLGIMIRDRIVPPNDSTSALKPESLSSQPTSLLAKITGIFRRTMNLIPRRPAPTRVA